MKTALLLVILIANASASMAAVVAADGSGDFKTVQDAVNAAPQNASAEKPWTIRIKPGTYRERVYVQREKRFVRLVGEDNRSTIITFDLVASAKDHDGKPIGTFRTPTVQIDADDFAVFTLHAVKIGRGEPYLSSGRR